MTDDELAILERETCEIAWTGYEIYLCARARVIAYDSRHGIRFWV